MMKQIYVVTGAAGHLGSYVVKELLDRGEEVRAFVLPREKIPAYVERNRQSLTRYAGDVCDRQTLDQLFVTDEDAEFTVIHCAGLISISLGKNPKVYSVNVDGTANVIAACREHQVRRLVYVSSVHAIPVLPRGQVMCEISSFSPDRVVGYYAKTKALATQMVLDAAKFGMDALVVHPSGIIGPNAQRSGNVAQMISAFLKGSFRFLIKGGFDFVDVRDVAAGIVSAADNGKAGECYILSNRVISLVELLNELAKCSGIPKPKIPLPLWVAKAVAPCAELYSKLARKAPFFTLYSLQTITGNSLYSNAKAVAELSYKTRSLEETAKDIVRTMTGNLRKKR
ncbi:MAG TPA: NAD-dependent epimerase/dehydratase family protein [Candidatus Syntrophosphaera sp.]|jgi:dihydroflavonol-4-reductase|nr:NAD-dependent epimerase/dehydratase family protein [Candidatus Syntrophosphaera sp.]HPK82925.1 NAD-dependent epimerase/dehydratase family protein [Candidatus Syntrophosphaera sp.]HPX66861.1 NAD-dependent epimerase/dehydratase family protein [Candidatus Syntrophosphaera sp.]HQP26671.1 NAD-dependent epimerase/dehydratase family protein [Candidatus Syntrophosphaera sp.]